MPGGGPGGGGRGGGSQERQGDSADSGHGLQCTDTDSRGKPHRTTSKPSYFTTIESLFVP